MPLPIWFAATHCLTTMPLITTRCPKMKFNSNIKDQALAKLLRLQKSSKYRSFFNAAAIDAFTKVEGSAFAGKPCDGAVQKNPVP